MQQKQNGDLVIDFRYFLALGSPSGKFQSQNLNPSMPDPQAQALNTTLED